MRRKVRLPSSKPVRPHDGPRDNITAGGGASSQPCPHATAGSHIAPPAFPLYMADVDPNIAEAREPLFLASDFPGHGSWRDRGRYGAYVKAIEIRKADRVRRGHPLSVQVLCLDAEGREKALADRYPDSR